MSAQQAFAGDAVKSWRFDHWVPIDSGVRPAPIVGDCEQYIWLLFGRRKRARRETKDD